MEKGWIVTILSIALSMISLALFIFAGWPLFLFLFLPPILLGFPKREKTKVRPMFLRCPNCGLILQGNENYCPNCGSKLR